MPEVKAPFVDGYPVDYPRIFLAGSIEMGAAIDWQKEVAEHLRYNAVVLNPRRDDWDATWTQEIDNHAFASQVKWELSAMETCDLIVMYLAPSTKSPITLLELGLYASSGKLIVCCPDEFWRKGNVEIVCRRYGTPMVGGLDQLMSDARGFCQAFSR